MSKKAQEKSPMELPTTLVHRNDSQYEVEKKLLQLEKRIHRERYRVVYAEDLLYFVEEQGRMQVQYWQTQCDKRDASIEFMMLKLREKEAGCKFVRKKLQAYENVETSNPSSEKLISLPVGISTGGVPASSSTGATKYMMRNNPSSSSTSSSPNKNACNNRSNGTVNNAGTKNSSNNTGTVVTGVSGSSGNNKSLESTETNFTAEEALSFGTARKVQDVSSNSLARQLPETDYADVLYLQSATVTAAKMVTTAANATGGFFMDALSNVRSRGASDGTPILDGNQSGTHANHQSGSMTDGNRSGTSMTDSRTDGHGVSGTNNHEEITGLIMSAAVPSILSESAHKIESKVESARSAETAETAKTSSITELAEGDAIVDLTEGDAIADDEEKPIEIPVDPEKIAESSGALKHTTESSGEPSETRKGQQCDSAATPSVTASDEQKRKMSEKSNENQESIASACQFHPPGRDSANEAPHQNSGNEAILNKEQRDSAAEGQRKDNVEGLFDDIGDAIEGIGEGVAASLNFLIGLGVQPSEGQSSPNNRPNRVRSSDGVDSIDNRDSVNRDSGQIRDSGFPPPSNFVVTLESSTRPTKDAFKDAKRVKLPEEDYVEVDIADIPALETVLADPEIAVVNLNEHECLKSRYQVLLTHFHQLASQNAEQHKVIARQQVKVATLETQIKVNEKIQSKLHKDLELACLSKRSSTSNTPVKQTNSGQISPQVPGPNTSSVSSTSETTSKSSGRDTLGSIQTNVSATLATSGVGSSSTIGASASTSAIPVSAKSKDGRDFFEAGDLYRVSGPVTKSKIDEYLYIEELEKEVTLSRAQLHEYELKALKPEPPDKGENIHHCIWKSQLDVRIGQLERLSTQLDRTHNAFLSQVEQNKLLVQQKNELRKQLAKLEGGTVLE